MDASVIAVIGGRSSGKSTFIASFVHHLINGIATEIGAIVRAVDDRTRTNYRNHYLAPLFEERRTLDPTATASANPVVREPLIYRIDFTRSRKMGRPLLMVLFDAAGEDLEDEETVRIYNRYIATASGIIFLLDPHAMGGLREALPPDGGAPGEDPAETVGRITGQIEVAERIVPGKDITTPTAFVLSKSDVLRDLVGQTSPLFRSSVGEGQIDWNDLAEVNEIVRSHLHGWGGGRLVMQAQRYRKHRFFAISALGERPVDNRITTLSPIRVADPFLWIMKELKYLR